jgi:hypothetical protein
MPSHNQRNKRSFDWGKIEDIIIVGIGSGT